MNLYKKPLSSSQYCHTEEEAVTNIHKVFYQKRHYKIFCVNGKYGIQV